MKDTYSPSSSCPEITFLPSPALSLPPLPQHPLPMDPLWSSPITDWKSFSRWPVQCQIQPLMVPPLNCPTKLYPLHLLWLPPQYSESSSQDPVLCPLSLFPSLLSPWKFHPFQQLLLSQLQVHPEWSSLRCTSLPGQSLCFCPSEHSLWVPQSPSSILQAANSDAWHLKLPLLPLLRREAAFLLSSKGTSHQVLMNPLNCHCEATFKIPCQESEHVRVKKIGTWGK